MKALTKTSVRLKTTTRVALTLTVGALLAGCGGSSTTGGNLPGSAATTPVTNPVPTPPVITPPATTPPATTPPVTTPPVTPPPVLVPPAPPPPVTTPTPVSMTISAAQGGTFMGPGVNLFITPGALAQDTVITETQVPTTALPAPPAGKVLITSPGGSGGYLAYRLGPDGTTFATPISSQFYIYNSLPANVPLSSLALYTVVNGAYQLVPGSSGYTIGRPTPGVGVNATITSLGTYAALGTVSP